MSAPIAALYSRPRSPCAAPPPPSSSISPGQPTHLPSPTTALLAPPRPDEQRAPLKRATLSLDPHRDDPFAAPEPLVSPAQAEEREDSVALGGEEWLVDSSLDEARQTGPQEPGSSGRPSSRQRNRATHLAAESSASHRSASVRRRSSTSSFLRALVPRPFRSSLPLNTNSSTEERAPPSAANAALAKQPRRARSSIQLERVQISAPLAGGARGGSLRVRGTVELISLQEAVERRRSWLAQESAEAPGSELEVAKGERDPVGHRSDTKTTERATTMPAEIAVARSLGRRASFRNLLFPRRTSTAAQGVEAQALAVEAPVLETKKGFKIFGGFVGSTGTASETTDKGTLQVDEADVVGLALTTDGPTRRIVPDNARYSFATLSSSVGSMRSRELTSTNSSVRSPLSGRIRAVSAGLPLSDCIEETPVKALKGTFMDSPQSPAPTIPLPALPVVEKGAVSTSALPCINLAAPTPGTTPASHRSHTSSRPPLPLGLATELQNSPDTSASAEASATVHRLSSRISAPRRTAAQEEVWRPVRPPRSSARTARSAHESGLAQWRPTLHVETVTPDSTRSRVPSAASTATGVAATEKASRKPVSSADLRAPSTLESRRMKGIESSYADEEGREPLVSLYLVCGLSREPRNWTEADRLDGPGMGKRWKAEVLGTMEGARKGGDEWAEMRVNRLDRSEKEKVQAKALKLAFDSDIEIVASPTQPPATTSFFTFTTLRPAASASSPAVFEHRYHCVALRVWSLSNHPRTAVFSTHHTQQRPDAARARIEAEAVRSAAKAARAGRRFSHQLLKRMRVDEDEAGTDGGTATSGAASESETEGKPSFDHEDVPPVPPSRSTSDFDDDSLWLPYAMVLISTSPLYTLLSDVLRISWARYHQDLTSHSLQMELLLRTPIPPPGEAIRIRVGTQGGGVQRMFFVVPMPGKFDWSTTVAASNYPFWPVFKALHADNLLTTAELALAPLGRIVFVSQYQILLSLATMTFQAILEARGWKGSAFPTVHVRDLKLFVEDPGPWLLGVPASPATAKLLHSLSPDTVLVDLDANLVSCASPFPGAISTGSVRDKARKRLEAAVGNVGRNAVPLDLIEAFPDGKFTPFSLVEVDGQVQEAERIAPHPPWQWDESSVLKELDAILAETPRVTVFGRLLRRKARRRSLSLDLSIAQVQAVARDHTALFVEERDSLEAEVERAKRRLQFLINQSADWQRSFQTFKKYSERAASEASELKLRLEQERHEARRLTGQLAADREHQAELAESLHAVEQAHEQAVQELARVDRHRRMLEHDRAVIVGTIQTIIHAANDEKSPVYQGLLSSIEALSQRSQSPSVRSMSSLSPRPPKGLALQLVRATDCHPDIITEEDEVADGREAPEETGAHLELLQLALQKTLHAVSTRLSLALSAPDSPGEADMGASNTQQSPSSFGASSPSRSAEIESDATLVSSVSTTALRSSSLLEIELHEKAEPYSPGNSPTRGFHPKALTLTPPVSPDQSTEQALAEAMSPFITMRTQQPRRSYRPRMQGHARDTSTGGVSIPSYSSGTAASMTPPARSLSQTSMSTYASGSRTSRHGWSPVPLTGDPAYSPTYPLSASARSNLQQHSRSASALSQLAYLSSSSQTHDTDDTESFVSVSEGHGGADDGAGDPLNTYVDLMSPSGEASDLEELALPPTSPTPAARRRQDPGHATAPDLFAISAPPVALFTRSNSVRSLKGKVCGSDKNPTDIGGSRVTSGRVKSVVQRYEQRA